MTSPIQPDQQKSEEKPLVTPIALDPERILCQHCLRTATNGIKCMGRCVADSDY